MTSVQISLVNSILSEFYGDLVGTVGSWLLKEGRSTIQNLQRVSGLSMAKIREALLILISRHLATFAEIEEKIGMKPLVYYNLEFEAVTNIIRYPQYIKCVHDLFGETASIVIQHLLEHGVSTVNVIYNASEMDPVSIKETCQQLALYNFISMSDPRDYKTMLDQVIKVQDEEEDKLDITAKMGSSKRKPANQKRETQKAALLSEYTLNVKRLKMSKEEEKEEIQENTKIKLRSNAIKAYVQKFINPTAGEVMEQILKQVNDNEAHCLTYRMSGKIAISNLLHGLPKSVKLSVDGLASFDGASNDRASALRQYLEAMMRSQVGFLRKADDVSMGGVYCVDFDGIVNHMRRDMLETFILDAFGEKSMRLFRTLERQIILDDKGLGKSALMSPKECRERLFQLFSCGLVEMQEVPRSQDRAPGRTIFLWKKSQVSQNNFLHMIYKSLLNVRKRRTFQNKQNRKLLDKLERTDVANDESRLSAHEVATLQALNTQTARMIAYEMRLDTMIQIQRDF